MASNQEMVNKFLPSQSAICSRTCANYAHSQYTMTKKACILNESVQHLSGISNYIVNEDIINMTQEVFGENQSGKYEMFILYFSSF